MFCLLGSDTEQHFGVVAPDRCCLRRSLLRPLPRSAGTWNPPAPGNSFTSSACVSRLTPSGDRTSGSTIVRERDRDARSSFVVQVRRSVTYVSGSNGTHVLEASSRKAAERDKARRFLSGRYRFAISSRSRFSSARTRASIYLIFTFAISGFGVNPSPKSSTSITLRISTSASPFGKMFGVRFTHSIASSSDFT